MKKRILAIMLAASLLSTSVPAICNITDTKTIAEAAKKKKKAPTIKKLHKAIAAQYGEDFVVNVALSKEEIKTRYGIAPSWYTDISAEVPMISANVDTLIIAKSKNATTKKKIKDKLVKYRKSLIADTMQYPMNVMKIQASKVYVKGDYVFFIMLGFLDAETEESGDDALMLKGYQALNQKAISAINALF